MLYVLITDPEGIANAQKSLGLGQEEKARKVRWDGTTTPLPFATVISLLYLDLHNVKNFHELRYIFPHMIKKN